MSTWGSLRGRMHAIATSCWTEWTLFEDFDVVSNVDPLPRVIKVSTGVTSNSVCRHWKKRARSSQNLGSEANGATPLDNVLHDARDSMEPHWKHCYIGWPIPMCGDGIRALRHVGEPHKISVVGSLSGRQPSCILGDSQKPTPIRAPCEMVGEVTAWHRAPKSSCCKMANEEDNSNYS
eukprot:2826139-Amphidinium_carterae.1